MGEYDLGNLRGTAPLASGDEIGMPRRAEKELPSIRKEVNNDRRKSQLTRSACATIEIFWYHCHIIIIRTVVSRAALQIAQHSLYN